MRRVGQEVLDEIDFIRKEYTFDAMGFFKKYMTACCESGIYKWQEEFFHNISVRQGRLSYALVGSPAVGKTTMVARLFIWKLLTMKSCNLTFMSMNEMQTRGVGLKTFENLIKRNNLERFFVTGDGRGIKTITGNEVSIARINEARQTAIRGKHCEGHSSSCMIFAVDEASEAPDFVFENILPNLSQQRDVVYDDYLPEEVAQYIKKYNVKSANCIEIIMTNAASGSNTQGYFYRAVTDTATGYEVITIADDEVRKPEQIDEEYWKIADARFTGFSDQYRRCQFAKVMNNLIDTEKLIEIAHRADIFMAKIEIAGLNLERAFINTKTILGVDVASGTGDCFTAFCVRRGNVVLYWQTKDLKLEMVAEEIQTLCAKYSVDEVYYDATGFGSALGDHVSGVNIFRFIGNARKTSGFANMRAQVLYSMGRWLMEEHTICPLKREEISYISGIRWFTGPSSDIYFQAKRFNRRTGQQEAADKVDALSYTFVNYDNPYAKSKSLLTKRKFTINRLSTNRISARGNRLGIRGR